MPMPCPLRWIPPLTLALTLSACGDGSGKNSPPADSEATPSSVLTAPICPRCGPISGGETSDFTGVPPACDRANVVTDAAVITEMVGKGPAELGEELSGVHTTEVAWTPVIAEPFEGMEGSEPLEVTLAYAGTSRLYPDCGNSLELDMDAQLSSVSGALDWQGAVILGVSDTRTATAHMELKLGLGGAWPPGVQPGSLDGWLLGLRPVARAEVGGFSLDLRLDSSGVQGQFSALAQGGRSCALGTWPAARRCGLGQANVDPNSLYRGLRAEFVTDELQARELPALVRWTDTQATTEMTVRFVADEGDACVSGDVTGSGAMSYQVLGQLQVATADGRLDVSLSARAETQSAVGDWTPVRVRTLQDLTEVPDGMPGWQLAPGKRPVVVYSEREEIAIGDVVQALGGIDVLAFAPSSPEVNTSSPLCGPSDFWGSTSQVASALYVGDLE